jgi:phosphodiesterase/alkaline phosphatase D-like protein
VALAIGRRFTALSALLLAFVAAFLGLLSSVAYRAPIPVAVTTLFAVPAVLEWYAWQHRRSVRAIVVLAVTTSAVLLGVSVAANAVYDQYWGPTHPESTLAAPPSSPAEWIWAGATTIDGTHVNAKVRDRDAAVRLAVSDRPDLSDARWSESIEPDRHGIARFEVTGLAPDAEYHYAIEVDGAVDTVRQGRVRTLPVGPASFRVAAGACAITGSNGAVFDTIRERDPLLYLALGDLHYANISTNSPSAIRRALDQVLTAPSQAALYRSTSTSYVWDDHDYGGNDADSTSRSRPAAHLVYREYVPHHALPSGDAGGIYHAFTVGRLRFIATDTRSYRSPPQVPVAERTLLGAEQLAWFEAELRGAAADDLGVVWLNPTPWVGEASASSDTWAGFDVERRHIADVIVALGLADRMVMLAGDAHMVAIDDGANTDYSSTGAGGFPLLHNAALDRPGGVKGGPYSEGTFPGGGQYGELDVDDDGETLRVTLRGMRYTGEPIVERTYTLALPPA